MNTKQSKQSKRLNSFGLIAYWILLTVISLPTLFLSYWGSIADLLTRSGSGRCIQQSNGNSVYQPAINHLHDLLILLSSISLTLLIYGLFKINNNYYRAIVLIIAALLAVALYNMALNNLSSGLSSCPIQFNF